MAVGGLILRLEFGLAGRIDTDNFVILQAQPALSRKIGTLIGGRQVVAPYGDPIWTFRCRVGPLTRVDGQLLRDSVGSNFFLRIEDTQVRTRPDSDIWVGPNILAEMLDVKQKRLGADILRGERFDFTAQFAQSQIGAA